MRFILRMLLPTLILFSPLIAYVIIGSSYIANSAKTVMYYDFYFILAVLSTITTNACIHCATSRYSLSVPITRTFHRSRYFNTTNIS